MLILRMTGDIEHALRIRFNNLISRVQEDGYQVIADYEKDQSLCYAKQDKPFVPENDYKKSVYTEGMIDKYLDQNQYGYSGDLYSEQSHTLLQFFSRISQILRYDVFFALRSTTFTQRCLTP